MTVKFNKNQIEVLKRLLSDAERCAEEYDSDSSFRGYISSGIEEIIKDRSAILPTVDLKVNYCYGDSKGYNVLITDRIDLSLLMEDLTKAENC